MTCATCARATHWKAGFVRCELLKPWEYLAGCCACVFTPSQWTEAKQGALL